MWVWPYPSARSPAKCKVIVTITLEARVGTVCLVAPGWYLRYYEQDFTDRQSDDADDDMNAYEIPDTIRTDPAATRKWEWDQDCLVNGMMAMERLNKNRFVGEALTGQWSFLF